MTEVPISAKPAEIKSTGLKNKSTRGLFPRVSLDKTIGLLNAIYELGHGDPVRRLSAFNQLGKSPDSGSSRTLLAAASGVYGLISVNGEYLALTNSGKVVITSSEAERQIALLNVLFDNDIFAEFVSHYTGRPIMDEVAADHIKASHNLSTKDAHTALDVFKQNMSNYGLLQQYSGRTVVISHEMALENIQGSPKPKPDTEQPADIPPEDETSKEDDGQAPLATLNFPRGQANPQFHFNIQIHLPENSSAEVYDAIFKSISVHLLGNDED